MLAPRILLCLSFLVGWRSLSSTFSHLWDPAYVFAGLPQGPLHPRYHFFREGMGDLGAILVCLMIVFSPTARRTPLMWWVFAVTIFFYYSPFWTAMPFVGATAPHWQAELTHILMAVFGLGSVLLSWPHFRATAVTNR